MVGGFAIHVTPPFGLSLSTPFLSQDEAPFDKLRANGNKWPVMMNGSLSRSEDQKGQKGERSWKTSM